MVWDDGQKWLLVVLKAGKTYASIKKRMDLKVV
jgi:hypothetical protein